MHNANLAILKKTYECAERSERPGGEFGWFVFDEQGYVGAFLTAGFGPVPDVVFRAGENDYVLLRSIIEEILIVSDSFLASDFSEYLDRGIFVYDFNTHRAAGNYELQATVHFPLKLPDLLDLGVPQGSLVPFKGSFQEHTEIVPEQYWNCR